MEVFLPGLDITDWIITLIGFVVALVLAGITAACSRAYYRRATFTATLIGTLFIIVLITYGAQTVHMLNQQDDVLAEFSEAYNLTIVQGDIPYEEDEAPTSAVVYLNDTPGEQSILIDIVDGHYVVTHNGELREVQND